MNLEITDDQTIVQVQGLFHCFFPFLKIDFFEKDNLEKPSIKIARTAITSRRIGEFREKDHSGNGIAVRKDMKVKEIEEYIYAAYALRAQVFRRSGNVWLETTVTNNWTLEEQNKQGEAITLQLQGNSIS